MVEGSEYPGLQGEDMISVADKKDGYVQAA